MKEKKRQRKIRRLIRRLDVLLVKDRPQYQWMRKGVPIPGATGSEYTLTPEDDRNDLSCQLIPSRSERKRQRKALSTTVYHGPVWENQETGERRSASDPDDGVSRR